MECVNHKFILLCLFINNLNFMPIQTILCTRARQWCNRQKFASDKIPMCLYEMWRGSRYLFDWQCSIVGTFSSGWYMTMRKYIHCVRLYQVCLCILWCDYVYFSKFENEDELWIFGFQSFKVEELKKFVLNTLCCFLFSFFFICLFVSFLCFRIFNNPTVYL